MRSFRVNLIILAVVAVVASIVAIASTPLVEKPLLRWFVTQINEPLEGYTIGLGSLDLHPLTVSLSLENLVMTQDALPEPPILAVRRIDGTIDWRALFSGARVVSVFVEGPTVLVDLPKLREEAGDDTPIEDKGWQEAFENVSPLEINELRVVDGAVTYRDEQGSDPIEIDRLDIRASNIRNVRSEPGVYPSPLQIDARVFGDASLHVEGSLDFLARPVPLGRVDFALDEARFERVAPVAHHAGLRFRKGVLKASGTFEKAATETSVLLRKVSLDGLEADYVESRKPPTREKKAVKAASKSAAKAATTSASETRTHIVIDSLDMTSANLGFVNAEVDPDYRLFVDVEKAAIRNFSNGERKKDATLVLDGRFMDSGKVRLAGTIRPDDEGPDLDLDVKVEGTEIKTLNEALRAHGRLDVVAGVLSVYSEVAVRNRRVKGYVKPIIVDLEVYDPAQDRKKPLLNKLYEGTVGAVAELFKNAETEQVATVTPIEGRLDAIDADGWRAFVLLLRNAFVEAIQAGLERKNDH